MSNGNNNRTKSQVFAASTVAAIISTSLTNPIQVVKLNLQYFPLACPFYPHPNYTYRQLIACGCYRFSLQGSLQSLKLAVPQVLFTNLIYMQMYQQGREFIVNKFNKSAFFSSAASAMIARFIVISINIPIESWRIRLSNEVKDNKINFHGYKAMLARDMPYSAIFWSTLEWYRNRQTQNQYRNTVKQGQNFSWRNFTLNMVPGFFLSALLSGLTTPLDTLKTRVQSKGIQKYTIMGSLKQIHQKQGISGLFSGVHWRMLRNSLHTALFISIYEAYMRYIAGQKLWQQ